MLDEAKKKYRDIEKLKSKQKIFGKLSIQICFDRKDPSFKLYDGISSIEISEKEFAELKNYALFSE